MDPTPVLHQQVIFSSDIFASGPQVTPLPDNTFVLAWENGTDIFARHLNAQGSFIAGDFLSTLSANDTKPLSTPRLFRQANGTLVVTYRELFGTDSEGTEDSDIFWHVVRTDFSPDGNKFPIENSGVNEVLMDSTSRTGGGGAIVYTVPRSNGIDTYTVLRFIDSIGQQASNQIFVGASSGQSQQNAVMAGLHNGNVVVAYGNGEGSSLTVRSHIYRPDETDVAGELIVSGNSTSSAFPDIAVLMDGSFVVAWQEVQGVGFNHMSQDGVMDQVPVNTVPHSSGALLPKVTALNDGGFLLAWTAGSGFEKDGSPNEDIFLQRYGFEGNVLVPIGSQVHLARPGDQGLFDLSIATLPQGRVVLAYGNETGDATNITTLNYRFVSVPGI
jgi:hypothetical protein